MSKPSALIHLGASMLDRNLPIQYRSIQQNVLPVEQCARKYVDMSVGHRIQVGVNPPCGVTRPLWRNFM